MKILTNHVILYDDECPVCDVYTKAFVTAGMLENNGREPYSKVNCKLKESIDQKRACDEIALVNIENGEVTYGIDSVFKILGNNIPLLKPLFSQQAFRWVMKKIYSFISFNRKVIIPSEQFEKEDSCTPTFSLKYRWIYIVFSWIATSLILNEYSQLLVTFVPGSNLFREFLICGGQIAFQSVVIFFLGRQRLVHYLGNMMTISFAGSLLLIPALWMAKWGIDVNPFVYLAWFGGVVTLMFAEHIRRVRILGIHGAVSLSWVVYRLLVLFLIL